MSLFNRKVRLLKGCDSTWLCDMDGGWSHYGVFNHRGSVDLPGFVMDGWWNHYGVFNIEVVINMV